MPIKFSYFDLSARGFPIRVCLRASGVDFEDHRVKFEEWGEMKASGFAPLGQLPVLNIDGLEMCESIPMSIYAARLANLYPTDPLEAYKVDELVAIIDEMCECKYVK